MLIREIIQMSKEKPIRQIAKDHLEIGEKKLTDTLKRIGATNQRGKRGWDFRGNSDFLELSIYDLVEDGRKASAGTKEQINKDTESQMKNVSRETINENTDPQLNKITDPQAKKITGETIQKKTGEIIKKRASFDLDVESLKKIKIYAVEEDLKVSEVVDRAIYLFLNSKGK